MTKKHTNILILSDLHIGRGARCRSMVPANEPQPAKSEILSHADEGLFEHLVKDLMSKRISIDYIFYPGDIADGGQIEQFEHFDNISTVLHEKLGIRPDQTFFTPGNHDVNWSEQIAGTTQGQNPSRWKQRFQPMSLSKSLQFLDATTLYDEPYWKIWNTDKICVISINTASDDGPGKTNHPGTIPGHILDAVTNCLKSLSPNNDVIKILLLHHHPLQYPNLFPSWKDFSILQSEKDIFYFCGLHRIDFLIHGHRHQPHFKNYLCDNGHELYIVSAGSVSHNFPSYVYGNISNQYHILSLHERDAKRHVFKGELHSFSFSQVSRWHLSVREHDGIDGVIPFGPHVALNTVIDDLRIAINNKVQANNICTYRDLLQAEEYVQHLTPEILREAVNTICTESGFRNLGVKIDELIVIRGAP